MSVQDTGGPAFPVDTRREEDGSYGHQSGHTTWQFGGMTLRDYFAGQALVGLLSNTPRNIPTTLEERKGVVAVANAIAAEMLKARQA